MPTPDADLVRAGTRRRRSRTRAGTRRRRSPGSRGTRSATRCSTRRSPRRSRRRRRRRLTSRKRSLPYWSPSLPSTGVATAETSRNAVKSHVAQAVVVCRSRCRLGSAGRIIVCCSAYASPASARIAERDVVVLTTRLPHSGTLARAISLPRTEHALRDGRHAARAAARPCGSGPLGRLASRRDRRAPSAVCLAACASLSSREDECDAGVQYLRARPRLIKGIQLASLVLTLGFCSGPCAISGRRPGRCSQHAKPALPRARASRSSPPTTSSSSSAGCASSTRGASASRTASRCRPRWSRCSRSTCPAASGRPRRAPSRCAATAGVTDTPTVLASILVEAALSAISGVIVFVVSLAWVRDVRRAAAAARRSSRCCSPPLLHPRIFRPLIDKLLKPFGARDHRAAAVPADARPAALLLRHVADRRLRRVLHAARRRRGRRRSRDDPVPRRRRPPSARSSPCSRSSRRRGSARARRRCTGCCSR